MKPEHVPHRFDDGTIRIGGELYGIAAEIIDRHGWVWATLSLMDGATSPKEIGLNIAGRFPELGRDGADRIIRELISTGYIEDGAVEPAGVDAERYSRNIDYFRRIDLRPYVTPEECQQKLRHSRVTILGVGGTGSHAAWALAAVGIESLHLVDPDCIEPSNLTRQALYNEADVGRFKAQVAVERLHAINSSGKFTCETRKISTERELRRVAAGSDLFVLCADEPRNDLISHMTSRVCVYLGIPWVSAGYNGPLVTAGVYGPDGPCFACIGAGEEAKLKPGWYPDMGGSGALAPAAGISGQLIAHEAVSLLTGTARMRPGYVRGINLIAPDQLVHVRHPALPECTLCNR